MLDVVQAKHHHKDRCSPPILYLFYNADLIKTYNGQPNATATGYIDDVAILRWGDATEETCNALGRTLKLANQWAS